MMVLGITQPSKKDKSPEKYADENKVSFDFLCIKITGKISD
jgi:hypothetical protein